MQSIKLLSFKNARLRNVYYEIYKRFLRNFLLCSQSNFFIIVKSTRSVRFFTIPCTWNGKAKNIYVEETCIIQKIIPSPSH